MMKLNLPYKNRLILRAVELENGDITGGIALKVTRKKFTNTTLATGICTLLSKEANAEEIVFGETLFAGSFDDLIEVYGRLKYDERNYLQFALNKAYKKQHHNLRFEIPIDKMRLNNTEKVLTLNMVEYAKDYVPQLFQNAEYAELVGKKGFKIGKQKKDFRYFPNEIKELAIREGGVLAAETCFEVNCEEEFRIPNVRVKSIAMGGEAYHKGYSRKR